MKSETSIEYRKIPEATKFNGEAFSSLEAPRLLIADDHLLVRDAIADAIRKDSKYEVFVADSLQSAIQVSAEYGPIDILLLDLYMPDMEGIKSIERAIALPEVKSVVLLSGSAPFEIVMLSIARGAKGYIPKSLGLRALVNALNFVLMGESYLPASLIAVQASLVEQDGRPSGKWALTMSESEVLRLVIEGLPNKEIARRCGTTEVRVKMHMRAICKKLGTVNRTSAALRAKELGLF